MKSAVAAGMIFGLALAAGPASAAVILAPGSVWEYSTSDPGPELAGPGNDWTEGVGVFPSSANAPFGNCPNGGAVVNGIACGGFTRDFDDPATKWAADGADGDDVWLRTTFDSTGYVLSSIAWDLGVDNGFKLYLNGTLVGSGNAEGYTTRWEYSGVFGGALVDGENWLAVELEDHGGLTAFDMQVTGDPVPEPATLLLLGSGLTGLAVRRRRRG